MERVTYRFPKSARLLKRRDFQIFSKAKEYRVGPVVLIEFRYGNRTRPRLGITVSRRFGKAHKRNRFKRIVREAFRKCQHQFCPQIELIVKPRHLAENASTDDIVNAFLPLIQV